MKLFRKHSLTGDDYTVQDIISDIKNMADELYIANVKDNRNVVKILFSDSLRFKIKIQQY